jgi:DNA polymerase-3 subunit gamma/tau
MQRGLSPAMYVVFARKYRPDRFEDVVGQQHVTRTLQNAVRSGRVAHAYLFCGSRGVGKTTVARILAKALNCVKGPTPEPCGECDSCRRIATGDDLDVMEIDGASNRGIDQVRDLRQNVGLAPAHSRFKIYYIDEVHMLTEPAFNALLKTLEEPPQHVKFIFSTTDAQKLPETVKSRCQRFDFRRIADAEIVAWLGSIAEKEGVQVEDGVLAAVARAARGGLRDALGALDQLAAFGETITMSDVQAVLGTVDRRALTEITDSLAAEDTTAALAALDRLLFEGTDVEDFADQLSQYLRDLVVARYCGTEAPMLAGSTADAETLERQSQLFSPEQITYMIQLLREAKLRARRDSTGRIALELAVIKMSRLSELAPLTEALRDLQEGDARPGPAPAARPRAPGPLGAPQPAPSGSRAASALHSMKEKLKNHKGGTSVGRPGAEAAADEGPDAPAPAASSAAAPAPEGIDEVTYRQIVSSADEPEAAVEAMQEPALLRAFVEADKVVGLQPLKVERRRRPQAPQERDEEEGG